MLHYLNKKYDIKFGFKLCALISLTIVCPNLITYKTEDMGYVIFYYFYFCFISFFTYCISQYIFSKFFEKKYLKSLTFFLINFFTIFLLNWSFDSLIFYIVTNFKDGIHDSIWMIKQSDMREHLSLFQTFFIYASRTIFLQTFFIFFAYTQQRRRYIKKIENDLKRLKNNNLNAQLQLLKQQISPHFLFNALSTLQSITKEEDTKNYILQLSNIYRYLLQKNDDDFVCLQEEIQFVNSYLYILKERFEDGLNIDINIDDDAIRKLIPPLSLQILIENAVKHNIVSWEKPLQIEIYNEDDFIIVKNNLQPKASTLSFGIGLNNIKKRYDLLNNKNIEIKQDENFFIVKLPLITKRIIV